MSKETVLQCPIAIDCWAKVEITGNLTPKAVDKLIEYLKIIKTTVEPGKKDESRHSLDIRSVGGDSDPDQ